MSTNRPRLGKGLEALIPKTVLFTGKTITTLPISQIQPNPYQPRIHFDPDALKSLADSIRIHGLNQPVVVRKVDNHYELIAGERRFRASQLAELESIPAIIKNVSDKESLQIALIENLEREDLNAIEEAKGYLRLIKEFGLTHSDVSEVFGKSRSTVSNTLRLLQLPQAVQEALAQNKLSEGHARTLLGLESEEEILDAFQFIQDNGLNVRQIESHISTLKKPKKEQKEKVATLVEELIAYEKKIAQDCQCAVKIKGQPTKGKIEIRYQSPEQLKAIYQKLTNG